MKGDVLTNAYLMNKLAKAQAELAQTVKSGSVPHPRRVMRAAGAKTPTGNGKIFEETLTTWAEELKPKPKRRRRKKETESL